MKKFNLKDLFSDDKKKTTVIVASVIITGLAAIVTVVSLFVASSKSQEQNATAIEEQDIKTQITNLQKEFDAIKISDMNESEKEKYDTLSKDFSKFIKDKDIDKAKVALAEVKTLKDLVATRIKTDKEQADKEKEEQEKAEAEKEKEEATEEQAPVEQEVVETPPASNDTWVEPQPEYVPEPAPEPQPAPQPTPPPAPAPEPTPPPAPPVASVPSDADVASFKQGVIDALVAAGGTYVPGFRGFNEFGTGSTFVAGNPYNSGYVAGQVLSGYVPGNFDVECYWDGEYLYAYGYFE